MNRHVPEGGKGMTDPVRIAIVGGGPMAVYALERLAAALTGRTPDEPALRVAVFERSGRFGAGEVYGGGPPAGSLMNRVAAQVAFAADGSSRAAHPLLPEELRPDLHQWASRRLAETGEARFALSPAGIPSRALHGEALTEMFATYAGLLEAAGTRVERHAAEVVDVVPPDGGSGPFRLHTDRAGVVTAERVLFVTGNARNFALPSAAAPRPPAEGGPWVLEPPYPLERQVTETLVPPGATVGVEGMGLTMIDVVLHLTEGRGGRFEAVGPVGISGPPRFRYSPGGREPAAIVAFSRTGLPPCCRPENAKLNDPSLSHMGRFFTVAAVSRLRASCGRPAVLADGTRVRQLDFDADVLPLVVLEMAWVYYTVLMGPAFGEALGRAAAPRADAFLDGAGPRGEAATDHLLQPMHTLFDAAAGNGGRMPDQAGRPRGRFDWRRLFDPLPFDGGGADIPWAIRLRRLMEEDLADGAEGNLRNPVKAACDGVLRDLRPVFGAVVDGGGLTPPSHARFLDGFLRLGTRLSNGAGIVPTAKLLALIEQGLVDVAIGPEPAVDETGGGFVLRGRRTGAVRRVPFLIRARLRPFDAADPADTLYSNLLRRGLVRRWINGGGREEGFCPGGLDLTPAFHPVGCGGAADARLTFLGTPAEGQRFFQSAAARPRYDNALFNALAVWAGECLASPGPARRSEGALVRRETVTATRQMHLGAFLYPTGYHVAAWRDPDVPADAGVNFGHFLSLAQTAERGLLDFVFLADSLAVRGRDLPALSRTAIRYVAQFEPLTLLSALAAVTHRIGLVASASTTYNEPYHLARKFASLDHISAGRAGWNLVTSQNGDEAENFGFDSLPPHARRYDRAREFIRVVKRLWDSWEDDAFRRDKASGLFFDPAKLHPAHHRGSHFTVRGPLNIPRPPQGHPVLVQSGSSEPGRVLAAEAADAVFTAQSRREEAQAFYADVKGRLAAHGRSPGDVKIIVGVFPYVGRTRAEAREKAERLQSLIDPVVGLSLLGTQLSGIDLSAWPVDGPLPDIPETNAGKSRRDLLIRMARDEGLTIRGLYERVAGGRGHWTLCGTAADIADQLEDWWRSGAADGFSVMGPALPDGLDSFVGLVVPELQRRGVFRTRYQADSFRGHLGLPRPPHPAHRREGALPHAV